MDGEGHGKLRDFSRFSPTSHSEVAVGNHGICESVSGTSGPQLHKTRDPEM